MKCHTKENRVAFDGIEDIQVRHMRRRIICGTFTLRIYLYIYIYKCTHIHIYLYTEMKSYVSRPYSNNYAENLLLCTSISIFWKYFV